MKTIIATVVLSLISTMTMAQTQETKGKVTDENGQPMCCVNVVLLSLPDSTFVTGTTTDANGQFTLTSTNRNGLLRLTSIGYETICMPVSQFGGSVQMRENSQTITEVTVKGILPKTRLTGNSLVTTIDGTVLGQSGSAKEMLAKVPGMMQNGDNLEVIGKGSPVIYINGRLMQDADELKRLRSEEIKDVEVINNPGAQYSATVTSVVRIRTKKRQGEGFGFDAEVSNRQNLAYGQSDPGINTNMRYRHNNFEVFGGINWWNYTSVNDSELQQWSYMKQNGNMLCTEQASKLRNDWVGHGLNSHIGFDWMLAENHSVGMRIDRNDVLNTHTEFDQTTDMKQYLLDSSSLLTHDINSNHQYGKVSQPFSWSSNAYYNGRVGKLGIDFNVDFMTSKSNQTDDIEEITNCISSTMSSSNASSAHMIADKLVFTYPLWRGQLSVGEEMSHVSRQEEYNVVGMPITNSSSKVKEDNIAAFAEYACMIPKVGSFSAGLRFEHVGMRYNNLLDPSKSMTRKTDDFFPSLSWAQQWGSLQTSLSYSIKTNRPNYQFLSESMIYINPYSRQQGDPKLDNEKKQELGLNLRWKWMLLGASYERIDNCLTQWSYIYNDEGVILIKSINMDVPVRNLVMYVNASPTWGRFSPNWTIGFQKPDMRQTLADPREASGTRDISYTRPIFFVNLNNALRLPHSWQIENYFQWQSQGEAMNFRLRNNTATLNFTVQKCWLKNDALCLRASINDVLQRSDQNVTLDCGYYTLNQLSHSNNHTFTLSLRYAFNATNSKYRGTGAGESQKSRLKDK